MTTKDKLASAHTQSGRCAARSVDQSTAVVGDTSGRRCAFGTTGRIVSRASTIYVRGCFWKSSVGRPRDTRKATSSNAPSVWRREHSASVLQKASSEEASLSVQFMTFYSAVLRPSARWLSDVIFIPGLLPGGSIADVSV